MRRLVCILVAFLVLAPTLALAQAYRCKGTGETHARCCCPKPDPSDEGDAPQITRTCCCDVIAAVAPSAEDRSSTTASVPYLAAPAVVVAAAFTADLPVTPRTRATPPRSGAPPAPIFLRHCSLLL